MKINEICGVSEDAFEAYPVDIDKDNKAFISLEAIRKESTVYAKRAQDILDAFSSGLLDAITSDDVPALKLHSSIGREINAYHLGYSANDPKGKGSSLELAINEMRESRLPFLPESRKFVDTIPILVSGIDADRMSDILGAILAQFFLAFTFHVLDKYKVPYVRKTLNGKHIIWDVNQNIPNDKIHLEIPEVRGRLVILVPRELVRERLEKTGGRFFRKVVLTEWKNRDDWPVETPSAENGLTEAKPMSKKQYLKSHPNIDAKKAIIDEFKRDNELMSRLLFEYLEPNL